jgi:Co/Zn/Cd efflux system component
VALNAAIFIVEAAAGFQAHSLSLVMDGIHKPIGRNGARLLYLAFVLSEGVSRKLLRSAHMFSSVGLIAISGLLLWQAIEQFLHPVPVQGAVAIVVGIAAAVANWGVAQLLYQPGRNNAAIRLAYIHNMGDVYVSIALVMAGLLVITTGYSVFDPIIACGIALWIIVSTVQEVFESREQLIWPEKVVCGHSEE